MKRFKINSHLFILEGNLTSTYCMVAAESIEQVVDKMKRDGFYIVGSKMVPWPPASIEEIDPVKEAYE